MKEELKNMSEESLKNLEEIVESELLTVEDIRERFHLLNVQNAELNLLITQNFVLSVEQVSK